MDWTFNAWKPLHVSNAILGGRYFSFASSYRIKLWEREGEFGREKRMKPKKEGKKLGRENREEEKRAAPFDSKKYFMQKTTLISS